MRKSSVLIVAVLLIGTLVFPQYVLAACTTYNIYGPGSQIQTCQRCCDSSGHCNTYCF